MLKPLPELLTQKREEITVEWAKRLKKELKAYSKRPLTELQSTTSAHFDAVIECLEKRSDSSLLIFLRELTSLSAQLGFSLRDTLEAFFKGWDIITKTAFD